jgi:hypothetical protein
VPASVHERDPDVLFWWGMATDDEEVVADAIGKDADTTVTDIDVQRR